MIRAGYWLPSYKPQWFRSDIAAGVTLAAYVLPAALGDASLAGLPPQAGLYACLYGGLVFWLFCSSRHTSISVTSAISLLIGSSLGSIGGGDPARFGAMAACTALLTATIAFLAWLARAGSVVNFVSETVLIGFKAGVALQLASTQLPKLFGVKGGHGNFWERMDVFFRHVGETNASSLMLGCAALAIRFFFFFFLCMYFVGTCTFQSRAYRRRAVADGDPLVGRIDEAAAGDRRCVGHRLDDRVERHPVGPQPVGIDEHLVLRVALAPDRDVRHAGHRHQAGPDRPLRQDASAPSARASSTRRRS